jgi:tetratricopeptide (TPR) repeat protein
MADQIALEAFHQALGDHRAGRLREAEQLYRSVLSSDPRHREALFNLAAALFHLQQLDEACLRAEQAIAADPQDAEESLARRSMSLRDILALAGPNVELVSLQKSCTAEELAELAARADIHAFDDEIIDFARH